MPVKGSLARLVATGFYSGYFPVAPGTAGSLALVSLWVIVRLAAAPSAAAHIIDGVALFIIGIYATQSILEDPKKVSDPSYVVIDEWIGMWIVLSAVNLDFWSVFLAFLLFRIFDVIKPWPVSAAESLPGAWGIVMDDVVAGFFALGTFILISKI